MRNGTITLSFLAADADEGKVRKMMGSEPRIRMTKSGNVMTFAVTDPDRLPTDSARDTFLKHLIVLRSILPPKARLLGVGPDKVDGHAVSKGLGLSQAAVSAGGVEIFRRYSASPQSVFSLMSALRSSGNKVRPSTDLSDDLGTACDAGRINAQLSRGLENRLVAEGEHLMGICSGSGPSSLRIVDEGHCAIVTGAITDAEGKEFPVSSDGSDVRILGGNPSLGIRQISLIADLATISSEMLREEKSRFDASLSSWASPELVTRNGRKSLLLGVWDGSEVVFSLSDDGSAFSSAPFCFSPDIEDPDTFLEIFGGEAVAMMRSCFAGTELAAS